MDFGFALPPRGPMATPENIATLAQQGEAMGFGILAVTDHIIFPKSIQSTYPGSVSGQYYAAGESQGEYLEPLALLSFLAGITSSAKLLTAVMVLPNRPPILTAKTLATIDVLSKGRVIVGCGVGWMREEFEALGSPPFEKRGAVGNEYIRAFRELVDPGHIHVRGHLLSLRQHRVRAQAGAEAPPAHLDRRRKSGGAAPGRAPRRWLVSLHATTCTSPWEVPGAVRRGMPPESRSHAQEAGRDPASMDFVYECQAGTTSKKPSGSPMGRAAPSRARRRRSRTTSNATRRWASAT